MLKKLLLSAVLCAASMAAMAQSQIITHVVQRGETLESIAKYYNISVADLNNANPNADGLIYVGMKLAVPVVNTAATQTTTTASSTTTETPAVATTSNLADSTNSYQETESQRTVSSTQTTSPYKEDKTGKFEPSCEFGIAFGQILGDGAKFGDEHMFKLTLGIHGAFGVKYFITEKFFAEALIGYRYFSGIGNRKTFEFIYGDGAHGEFTTHSIYIPLYFGVKIDKLMFKAGPYFDNIVKGKYVAERAIGNFKQTVKVEDGKFSVGLNFCAAYDNYGVKFNIGLSDYGGKILDGGAKEMAFGIFMIF